MEFRPLHDRVVVKRADQEAKTSGGIIIPDTAGEKTLLGKVMAVVRGNRDEPGNSDPSTSRRVIKSSLANGPAVRSRSTATSC